MGGTPSMYVYIYIYIYVYLLVCILQNRQGPARPRLESLQERFRV